jgi:hypothetical protein
MPLVTIVLLATCGCRGIEPEAALIADTAELSATRLLAGLDAPFTETRNQIWCASLDLAWQALVRHVGEPIRTLGPGPGAVERLNASAVREDDLEPEALELSVGGPGSVEVPPGDAELQRAARDPELALLAFARLEKLLPFEVAFDDLRQQPVDFHYEQARRAGQASVDVFGIESFVPGKETHRRLSEQVAIWRYEGPEDFVFELVPEGRGDRLLFARGPTGSTLAARWAEVEQVAGTGEPQRLRAGDRLVVPEIDVDLRQAFHELAGLDLDLASVPGAWIMMVEQDLRLRLDEHGALVRSRAFVSIGSAVADGPRELVLDGPFLLAAIERTASHPYLVAWIAHPELLLAAGG